MKRQLNGLSKQYQAALRKHLEQGPGTSARPAQRLGRRAIILGLETLDLARIHEQALITLVLPNYSPNTRNAMIRRAGVFFAEAITPLEKTHSTAVEANVRLDRVNHILRQRIVDLDASTTQLRQEIAQRKSAEKSLKRSERHHNDLLEQSRRMQEQMRFLSRQLLSAQEEERKQISRELHDVIAQTLAGINVRLAALKKEAAFNPHGLEQNIIRTQLLVQESVDVVHRFARELRPTALDDLGLIPALHTFMKAFMEQTGIRVSLSAFAAVEKVDDDKRTALYRVVQEALTNVARHAQASEAGVNIQKLGDTICLTIKDNGKGFPQAHPAHPHKSQRLGLLGMRERVEMVGGNFTIQSAPGTGTTVEARLPLGKAPRGRRKTAADNR